LTSSERQILSTCTAAESKKGKEKKGTATAKELSDQLEKIRVEVEALKKKKMDAVAAEDYDTADKLKAEEEAKHAEGNEIAARLEELRGQGTAESNANSPPKPDGEAGEEKKEGEAPSEDEKKDTETPAAEEKPKEEL
jgi:hypothetical protein